jgi:aspartyl-tRNA(Asn)/glutamyl-tRNA(Gln) amidotransferase subunit C
MLRFHVPEAFTAADVERLAALARLALTPDEITLFTSQLAHFLSYAEQLQRLDTSGIAPTSHATGAPSALRQDEVVPCLPREQALEQAPAASPAAGLFKVPRVIG